MTFFQRACEALVRKPGFRRYGAAVAVSSVAAETWELAVLSDRIYERDWALPAVVSGAEPELIAWSRCDDCISSEFRREASSQGLYLEVWRHQGPAETIAVVFKGTNFLSLRDWKSNLRWVLRFVPWHRDQYTVLCDHFGQEFTAWATVHCEPGTRLVATGHSLGGGIAQQFAYALPQATTRDGLRLRVSYVCAFDPSPVTGWFSVDATTRSRNATGLHTDQLFEHGEILAYVRLLLSYLLPPSAQNPAVQEIRVNFDPRLWIVMNHMMNILAAGLVRWAGHGTEPAKPC